MLRHFSCGIDITVDLRVMRSFEANRSRKEPSIWSASGLTSCESG